eukprot:10546771-Alexandrium_andersonii.AAC.1
MSASLVGSEMCIRDRSEALADVAPVTRNDCAPQRPVSGRRPGQRRGSAPGSGGAGGLSGRRACSDSGT